jgi:hypothetical protein
MFMSLVQLTQIVSLSGQNAMQDVTVLVTLWEKQICVTRKNRSDGHADQK